jgi:hypothetical protein
MAETPNVEEPKGAGAGTEPKESASTPSSKAVEGSATPPLPEFVEAIRQVVREEFKPLKSEVSATYSRQDKTDNAFREFMAEYRKQQKKGLSDTEAEVAAEEAISERKRSAKREEVLDALAERFLNDSSTDAIGNSAGGAVNAAKAFQDVGLDLTDPRVAVELQKQYKDDNDALLSAYRLRDTIQKSPNPTLAQGASLQGGTTSNNVDQLLAEMNELQKKGDFSAIQAKAKELREAGATGW